MELTIKFLIMIAKKNGRADLERKRGILFQIGMLAAGSFTLAAFTYTSPLSRMVEDKYVLKEKIEFEMVEKEEPIEKPVELPRQTQQQTQSNATQVNTNTSQQVTSNSTAVNNTNTTTTSTVTPPGGGIIITTGTVDIDEPVIEIPEIDASFPGGYMEMMKFIQQNIDYPEDAMEFDAQGKVYISFVVEKDGSISNIEVDRKVFPSLDREAKRVVREFPKWIPGEMKYGKVRTKVSLPISFVIAK